MAALFIRFLPKLQLFSSPSLLHAVDLVFIFTGFYQFVFLSYDSLLADFLGR